MADFGLMQSSAAGLRGEGDGISSGKSPSKSTSHGGQKGADVATAIAKGLDLPANADTAIVTLGTTNQQAATSSAKSSLARLRQKVDATVADGEEQEAVALCSTRIDIAKTFLTVYAHTILTDCTLPIERESEVLKALSSMVVGPATTLITEGVQILLDDVKHNTSKHKDEVGNLGKNDKVMCVQHTTSRRRFVWHCYFEQPSASAYFSEVWIKLFFRHNFIFINLLCPHRIHPSGTPLCLTRYKVLNQRSRSENTSTQCLTRLTNLKMSFRRHF